MAKVAFPAMLALLMIVSVGAGVDEACRKTPDAKFCTTLLQPYESQLADNDPVKTGWAAMNATLGRVDGLRHFMVKQAVQEQTSPEEQAALTGCLSNVGNSEGAVQVAGQTLNATRGAERDELLKMIDGATAELTACADSLKKHMTPHILEASRLNEETIQACFVAKALLPTL